MPENRMYLPEGLKPVSQFTLSALKDAVETGEILEAEMLTVLEMDGNEYAVYTIPGENGKRDVLASRVIQDGDGFDMLIDLESQVVKENIRRFIEETVLRAQNPTAKA